MQQVLTVWLCAEEETEHRCLNDLLRARILTRAPGSQASVSHYASSLSELLVNAECLKEEYKLTVANSYKHGHDLAPCVHRAGAGFGEGETCTKSNLRGNLYPFTLAPVSDLASSHDYPVS